jgi:hypothetical protein
VKLLEWGLSWQTLFDYNGLIVGMVGLVCTYVFFPCPCPLTYIEVNALWFSV